MADAASQQSVPYATISLVSPATNKPVDGTMADEKGQFVLERVANGSYNLVITFIGYETKTIAVEIAERKAVVDLGKIALNVTSQRLQEVRVEGQRAMIEEKVDRTV